MNLEFLAETDTWVSLLTLTAMEIVLGIDNVVFISILTGKLPPAKQPSARRLGLSLALILRLGLLFALSWVMGLTEPLFTLFGKVFSGRSLILLGGGLFLVAKATHEIYDKLEVAHDETTAGGARAFGMILVQILALDIVFSLDSVVGVMLVFAQRIGDFVNRHPSMKILALSFLLLIGVMLVAEGMGQHVGKGYIYFAMAFSLGVELLNMRLRKKVEPVTLHNRFESGPVGTKSAPTSS
jgi:predicted tellurium resistance membrane protein TerC